MCQFEDDNWVETAMADVTFVANFLLTMKKSSSSSSPHPSSLSPPLNLHWTVRQRRSNSRSRKMKTDTARASPTTPLSWSAATSASGADGNEESSRLSKPVHTSRSKVDEQSEANANKRLKKKRSLPELLEEERLLLKERGNLKDKVASMHLNLGKQRANNESLKKMKLDLVSQKNTETARISLVSGKTVLNIPQVMDTNRDSSSKLVQHPTVIITDGALSSKLLQPNTVQEKESVVITEGASSSAQQQNNREINNRELPFLLPDLNLSPEEE